MFDEYDCGCIVSIRQGRVRICATHRTRIEDGRVIRLFPTSEVIRRYPGNGRMVPDWVGR